MTASRYDHWRANLAGQKPPIHAGDPQCGYYRYMLGGVAVAAAIWIAGDGSMVCRIGGVGNDCRDCFYSPTEKWVQLARHPISEDAARVWFETGKWPHEAAAATPEPSAPVNEEAAPAPLEAQGPRDAVFGDNSGAKPTDDIFDAISREATVEIEHTTEWLERTKIETQAQADFAGDKIDTLRKLWKKADEARAAEKAPHLQAGRDVDDKWRATLAALDQASAALKAAAIAWKQAEDAKRERARKEAEAARAEAAAKGELPIEAPPELPPPEPIRIGGTSGKRIGFRKVEQVRITDIGKAFRHQAVRSDPRVVAAIEAALNDLFKASKKVPAGSEKYVIERAA